MIYLPKHLLLTRKGVHLLEDYLMLAHGSTKIRKKTVNYLSLMELFNPDKLNHATEVACDWRISHTAEHWWILRRVHNQISDQRLV